MSIENDLKRIADALEKLVADKHTAEVVSLHVVTEADKPTPPPPPPHAPDPVVETMTKRELNDAIVTEFLRIGSRDGIDAILKDMCGIGGIEGLSEDQYSEALSRIQML